MVTLYAGKSAELFKVHKEFACHYSPFLKAAFNSNFVEGQTQTYQCQDTSEVAVRLLIHWFYTQTLDTKPFNANDRQAVLAEDRSLVKLWILADKMLIPRLQNLVVEKLVSLRSQANITLTHCIDYIYKHTAKGSPLPRLLLH
jgi:hypothetical protein